MNEKEITASEAAKYLNVSPGKLCTLLKNKQLPFRGDPLDNRKKLIKVSDLDKLRAGSTNHQ